MSVSAVSPYFHNAFWLLLPILAFNVIFMKRLPPLYQMDVFWKNIPAWIGVPENVTRVGVFLLPLLMRFGASSPSQKLGIGLYVTGVLCYFTAWGVQIVLPGSAWSVSAVGFMGPSYTPLVWLTGLALIGDSLTIPQIPYRPEVYLLLSIVFLGFHNAHAWLVHSRP